MTNPGSLTMGFAGVDPHQLAPSVGTTQVGITISAVPSSASHNSRARTRSSPLEGFKITANISAAPPRLLGLQLCQDQYYGNGQVQRQQRRNRRPRRAARGLYEGIPLDEPRHAAEDSPTVRRPTAARTPATQQDDDCEFEISDQQNHRQRRRNRQPKRLARGIHAEVPLDESRHAAAQAPVTRRPTITRTPAASQDSDSETPVGEYYDPDQRPDEFANLIKNQDMSRGIETDPRFHAHPADQDQIFRISRRKRHAGSSKLTVREQLEGPCTIHCFEDDWGRIRSAHTLGDCRLFNELADSLKEEKQREAKHTRRPSQSPTSSPERRYNSPQGQVHMIQEGRVSQAQRGAYTL